MKKFLFSIAIALCFFYAQSQTVPAGENISLNEQLSNIPQTSVTSGIIYERVIPVANLYNYNATTTFNTANYSYFKQVLSEMHLASNATKFISVAALKNIVQPTVNENEVDLALLNTQFSILNYNEEYPTLGGLTYNTSTNKFVQIPTKVPFYEINTSVIAPTKDYATGTNITYKFRNDLYFANSTKKIKTVVADFGDGQSRNIISNYVLTTQNIVIPYTSSGDKILKFTITYVDNTTLITYGKIYFHYKPVNQTTVNGLVGSCHTADPLKKDYQLQADIAFTGYNPGDPKVKAKIDYRIFYAYAHTDKKVRKPIIIIDGFDPGDKRKIEDCDCADIPDCASRNTTDNNFDPDKHNAMIDAMHYFEGGVKKQLLNKLRVAGFDVIAVNHPTYTTTNLNNGQQVQIDGGAYYIESNAMALVKLLQQTQALLSAVGSTNKIAIVGPSMGGQISRYALSYMEKNGIPHNTNLWISVDSPHLGANIPMGDQALLYLLKEGGVDAATDFYDKELSSPAAQQQLIEFHRPGSNYHTVNSNMLNAQTNSINMPINRGNAMFQKHYNNQKNNGIPGSNGWPQNLRKIAVVNGSLSGSKETQDLTGSPFISFPNDGDKVLNLRGFQRVNINLPWPFGSITFRTHIASLEAHSMPSYGSEARLARFKKLLTDRTTKATNMNSRGNIDNAPGGYFDAQADIADATTSQDPVPGLTLTALHNWSTNNISIENIFKSISELLGGSEWYRHEFNPIHSFIPSFSAIAHQQPNQSWANPLNTNLACPTNKVTPFDSYFGLEKNTQHTSFTAESVDWLLKELAGEPQTPYYPVSANSLVGSSHICKDANSTLTFSDLCKIPSPVIYNGLAGWSVEGNLAIVSYTDYSVIVKGTSDTYSTGKVKARFSNGSSYTKNVTIGKPAVSNAVMSGSDSRPLNSSSSYGISTVHTATQYQWILEPVNTNCGGTTNNQGLTTYPAGTVLPKFATNNAMTLLTSSNSVSVNWGNCKGNYIVKCRAVNSCGVTEVSSKWVTIFDPYNPGDPNNPQPCKYGIKIAPNPIKDGNINVIFGIVNPNGPPCGVEDEFNGMSRTFAVKIYDLYGQLMYQNNYNQDEFTISNLNFKKGHYILNLTVNGDFSYRETFVME